MPAEHHRPAHDHPDVDERVDAIVEALRSIGGRITTGRRAIIRALYEVGDHHVTADDIAATVQAQHPDVHLSTVYRTLESLEQLGVVERVTLGPGGAVFHLADHAHNHLLCESCGAVIEIPVAVVRPLARSVAQRYDFDVSTQHLVLPGRCGDCRS